jgi:cell division protein FtsB
MNRNRKSQSAAIRLVPAIKALFLCLFFGGAATGYVWQQRTLHELDVRQRQLESQLDSLRVNNRDLSRQIADLQQPLRLQERVRRLPGLAPAKLGQVVRLPDPVPASEPLLADPVALERQSALVAHPAVND